jgi:hypothetical protein
MPPQIKVKNDIYGTISVELSGVIGLFTAEMDLLRKHCFLTIVQASQQNGGRMPDNYPRHSRLSAKFNIRKI